MGIGHIGWLSGNLSHCEAFIFDKFALHNRDCNRIFSSRIQIGLDKKFVSEDTRILFCTTGVLLEKLIHAKTLTNYTHIVLDEVHERNADMDFLFIIIRMLWAKDGANVKIILMSATIDTIKVSDRSNCDVLTFRNKLIGSILISILQFAEYFRFYQLGAWVQAPIVKVDKKSLYTVQEYYIDNIAKIQVSKFCFHEK